MSAAGAAPPSIEVSVPVRICDNGGWTDTWFGAPGRVLNIAVRPGVEVSIRATGATGPVMLDVATFGDRYPIVPGAARRPRHPLLEAAIDTYPPPGDGGWEIVVRSAVPAGCGTGTSAAVAVALLGGLAAVRGEQPIAIDVAYAAHRLEVDALGLQSGIQDQLAAALGGINFLEIAPYPEATVHPLPAWEQLGQRLTLVFLGRPHHSSSLHRQVIENLKGPRSRAFAQLRGAAEMARDAVVAQDLNAFGQAMIANTEAQGLLHPQLVGREASRVIRRAAAQGAIGWKVNGAGGDGGSITVLSDAAASKEAFERSVVDLDRRYRVLPIQVSPAGPQVRAVP